ncbi:MAG: DUF4910 domain-containing protein [Candidatus Thorarchaeota archaeon]
MKDLSKFIDVVLNEVSGKYAFDWVSKISQYNRVVGSRDYHENIENVVKELRTFGLDEIKVHKYPADGKTKTWEWIVTQSWEIKSAELNLMEPMNEIICRFQDIPMCILGRSKACDVKAELIDVGKGIKDEDYEGLDVQGKIVLMEAPRIIVPTMYAEKGALGVIVYPPPERAAGYKSMTIYNRFPAIAEDLEKTTFGFSIPFEKGIYLKDLLKKGPVKLHAKVDAEIYDGELEVISAAIKGIEKPQEEIILTAHICHPAAGANDNASGSAGLLELARSLTTLIKKKIIQSPRRTIRFLWVPEFHGTLPWVKEHENTVKNALFNINLDMIGEHPLEVGNPCNICLAPYSRPSILNDIIQYFTRIVADHPKGRAINGTQMQMRYRIVPYTGGSDHSVFVARPITIPAIMIGHEDPYWHSSLDTIEKCDSTELKRVISIALCTSYTFSIQNKDSIMPIWPIIERGYYERLGKVKEMLYSLYSKITQEIREYAISKDEIALIGKSLIFSFLIHQKSVLDSVKKFDTLSTIIEEFYDKKVKELEELKIDLLDLWYKFCKDVNIDVDHLEEPDYLKQKWVMNFIGRKNLKFSIPLAVSNEYKEFKVPEPPDVWGGDAQEMLNFIGLSLNLKEICAMLTLEFQHLFTPNSVLNFAKLLEKEGFISRV